jgi:small-conductance mechanosensitive channel
VDRLTEYFNIQQITTMLVAFLPRLLVAIFIFCLFLILFRVTRRPLEAVLTRAGLDPALINLLVGSVYRITVVVLGLVMAASQIGVNVGAALAGIGVIGIAIGFAAQDSLANTIAGFLIFIDKPFLVGDWVTVSQEYGRVSNITLRSTRIRTPQNTYVVIPNKNIIDSVLVNHSKNGETRVDVPIGIAYKEDIRRARDVMLRAVRAVDFVLLEPAPDVIVASLGNSSIDLLVRVWIDDAASERAVEAGVLEHCKIALDQAGIQIPFPHLQLFVDTVEERVWERLSALRPPGE